MLAKIDRGNERAFLQTFRTRWGRVQGCYQTLCGQNCGHATSWGDVGVEYKLREKIKDHELVDFNKNVCRK